MKKYSVFLLLAALAWFVAGCSPEIDFIESSFRPGSAEMSISGGNLSIVFPSAAGSASVDLKANGKWTAAFVNDRANSWCSISAMEGKRGTVTITVTVDANAGYDDRSASINFVCGEVQRTILVTQKQKNAVLLSSTRQDVKMQGGQFTIELRSNVPYTYTISRDAESWLTVVGTKGLSTSSVTFGVTANESPSKREGEIVFSSAAGTETVKVYQDGEEPTIVVSSSEVSLSCEPEAFSVDVRSNLDVSVEIQPSCDWLQEVKTKTYSTNTYYFAAERNDGRYSRSAWIAFHNASWGVSDTVRVTQDIEKIVISPDSLQASGRGWTVSVETAGSNPDLYRFTFADRWLSLAGHEKLSEGLRFLVDVQGLKEDAPARDSYFLVYYRDMEYPDTIRVHQFEWFPAFSYSTTAKTVSLPEIEGDDQLGFIRWGDDVLEPWQEGLTHTYAEDGQHIVTVEVRAKKRVVLPLLENEITMNLRDLRK